jgi:hypothetical protein
MFATFATVAIAMVVAGVVGWQVVKHDPTI